MSDSSDQPWSNNPNAPQISSLLYFSEKLSLVGFAISAILYGIAMAVFFLSIGALLNPVNRAKRGVKWGLVVHTAAMFSVLTLGGALAFDSLSLCYIDDRDFYGGAYPGPNGYRWHLYTMAITIVPSVMFYLNTFLADGFLLYRCYVIYSMNCWVMAIPCMMYLASLGLSIVTTYLQTPNSPKMTYSFFVAHFQLPYYSISLSLNILLTLMIATRLIIHRRNIRNAVGSAANSGLYTTVVAILVESCALYAVASLLMIGTLGAQSPVLVVFSAFIGPIQVIAPFLITLRVANQTAFTSDTVASVPGGTIRFKTQESTGVSGTIPDGNTASWMETNGGTLSEPGTGSEDIIEHVPL